MQLTQMVGLVCLVGAVGIAAIDSPMARETTVRAAQPAVLDQESEGETSPWRSLIGLPVAAALGAALAFRPVRRGTPARDPKDAAVMLVALAVGLASGIGVYLPAAAATAFILLLLWALESIEPAPIKVFDLTIKGDSAADIRPRVEKLLHEQRLGHELRATGQEELSYQVTFPARRRTNRLAADVLALDPERQITVELEPRKKP